MRPHPALITILALASCAAPAAVRDLPPGGANAAPAFSSTTPGQEAVVERCKMFKNTFDELVACQRANGTLESFTYHQIAWRVRFFVRYDQMPCNEAPTVKEAYVFHTVTDDLNNDGDLDYAERLAIRNAMFHGKVRCSE